MIKRIVLILSLIGILAVPFIFKKEGSSVLEEAEDVVVVITPHNESLRYEFTQGFKEWYHRETGRTVTVDWRVLGGTQEIVRLLNTLYTGSFKAYWEGKLGREWSDHAADVFLDAKVKLGGDSSKDTSDQKVRRAFLESNVSSGIDIVFGGGEVESKDQADIGYLVGSDLVKRRPEWFNKEVIPDFFAGVPFRDEEGRWFGTAYSGFGMIYNRDVLAKVGVYEEPRSWRDLTRAEFVGSLAMADPMISASTTRAFDMILQQSITNVLSRLEKETGGKVGEEELVPKALREGWAETIRIVELICANAKYFTDSSTKPVLDVSSGDCAIGMAIDFYGLFQEQNLKKRSDSERFRFVTPKGGSVATLDSIGLLRGAPNRGVAEKFIEYILSEEGQKLWCFKVGVPGGPKHYTLRRPPIRKDLYKEEYKVYRTDPELNPYRDMESAVYRPDWTVKLFKVMRFVVKAAFIDTHEELVGAWKAVIRARNEGRGEDAERGMAKLQDLELIGYEQVVGGLREIVHSGDALKIMKLQSFLNETYRKQFKEAKLMAEGKK